MVAVVKFVALEQERISYKGPSYVTGFAKGHIQFTNFDYIHNFRLKQLLPWKLDSSEY